ncbi:MAG: hypothetical protein ACM31D_15765 [Bacteroidota bacterium]
MNTPYELVQGTISRVSRASRWEAIVQLKDHPAVIQLSTSDPWVLHPGDAVAFLGRQGAKSGKFYALCYRNVTVGVGWYHEPNGVLGGYLLLTAITTLLFWLGAHFDLPILWLPVAILLLIMFFKLDDLIEDVRYSRALKRYAAALAIS